MIQILRTADNKILRTSANKFLYRAIADIFYPEYGLLYNFPATIDIRNITSIGWHVPTKTEWEALWAYIGNTNSDVNKLRETGIIYWFPTTTATNQYNFNGRGDGQRNENGGFQNFRSSTWLMSSTPLSTLNYTLQISKDVGTVIGLSYKKVGRAIRLIKDSTTLSNGQTGTYTGNNGNIYRTICINGVEYLAYNLSETKFRNGDIIPWYGANSANYFTNAEWAALTTPGCCAYSNNLSNVAAGFTFPT